jgi:dihydropyrimidinase
MVNEFDLRLDGGRVVTPSGVIDADIAIRDGRIAALLERGAPGASSELVDISGRTVMPGAVDAHVHLGANIAGPHEPGEAGPETASAVAGGVTTMLTYLIGPDGYDASFEKSHDMMSRYSHTDFGFHFCIVTREQLAEIPRYAAELGVSSFKFFMNFRGEEGAYLGVPGADDSFMYDLLRMGAETGVLINAHAENVELIWRLRDDIPQAPDAGLREWYATRPPFVEAEAAQRAAYLAGVLGASLYVVHVSSREPLDAIQRQRAYTPNVFIETCPHYLTLTQDSPAGSRAKVNPPLRVDDDREALWEAVRDGRVDTIGSDHVPRHFSAKDKSIWAASAGFPGTGTLLPTLISEGHVRRGIPLERIAEVTAERPARLFGMYPQKGRIAVGADADLAIVDLDASDTIEAARLHSAAEYTPWEGATLDCRITDTLVRGRFAMRDGVVTEPAGRYLARPHSGAAALATS